MKAIYFEVALGVDIRADSVTLVLLGKQWRKQELLGAHKFPIQNLEPGNEEAEAKFFEEVNQFLSRHSSAPEHVALGLPRKYISFQTFNLPAPDIKVVDSMIGFELERHFSSDPANLYYSYQARQIEKNEFSIYSCAVRKDQADYFLGLIQHLGLTVTRLSASSLGTWCLVPHNGAGSNAIIAMVDIEPRSLEICLFKDGVLAQSQTCPVPENSPIASLDTEMTEEQMEQLSLPIANEIVEGLTETLSSSTRIDDGESIAQIHLSGAGNWPGVLANRIEEQTQVPTAPLVPPPDTVWKTNGAIPFSNCATAFSLAGEEIRPSEVDNNLLPSGQRPKRKKANIKMAAVLLGIVLLLAGGFLASGFLQKSWTLASLDKQLKDIQQQAVPFQKIDETRDTINMYLEIISAIQTQSPMKLPVLDELTSLLPQNTWVTEIRIKENELEIKGYSSKASALIPILESSPFLKDVAFKGTTVKSPKGEKFTIRSIVLRMP